MSGVVSLTPDMSTKVGKVDSTKWKAEERRWNKNWKRGFGLDYGFKVHVYICDIQLEAFEARVTSFTFRNRRCRISGTAGKTGNLPISSRPGLSTIRPPSLPPTPSTPPSPTPFSVEYIFRRLLQRPSPRLKILTTSSSLSFSRSLSEQIRVTLATWPTPIITPSRPRRPTVSRTPHSRGRQRQGDGVLAQGHLT